MYYHLGAFEESLTFALGAGSLFNVNDTSEYVETIIGDDMNLQFIPHGMKIWCPIIYAYICFCHWWNIILKSFHCKVMFQNKNFIDPSNNTDTCIWVC